MAELIKVKATDPDRVALWERDERHPDGEVFVYGADPFTVALTPRVLRLLNSGALVKVEDEAPAVETPAPKTKKAK
jgi:hypothetical protein